MTDSQENPEIVIEKMVTIKTTVTVMEEVHMSSYMKSDGTPMSFGEVRNYEIGKLKNRPDVIYEMYEAAQSVLPEHVNVDRTVSYHEKAVTRKP